jgi:hypothetical protein
LGEQTGNRVTTCMLKYVFCGLCCFANYFFTWDALVESYWRTGTTDSIEFSIRVDPVANTAGFILKP